jgi:hypothetical protein
MGAFHCGYGRQYLFPGRTKSALVESSLPLLLRTIFFIAFAGVVAANASLSVRPEDRWALPFCFWEVLSDEPSLFISPNTLIPRKRQWTVNRGEYSLTHI